MKQTKLLIFFIVLFSYSKNYAQNVGIGTNTPVNKLSVNGKVNITDSLGIGVSSPAAVLHLQSSNISDTSRGDIIFSRYWNGNSDTRASSIFHYSKTGPNSDNLAFGVSGDGGSFLRPNSINQIKMLIQANGNVGIGTLIPAQKLDVFGTTKTTNLQITNGASNGFILKSDASGNASWVNANTTETDPKVGTLTSNKIPKWNDTALADGLLFDNGTNIGIGTTTPSRKLTVVNPLSVGIAQLSGTSSARTSIGIGREDVEGTLNIAANSNEFFVGATPGDIVLRTETSGQRLVLNSGGGEAALTVLNGNVGVGTVTPAQKLDVSGTTKTTNLQITNGASNGFILKSDASGNASWVNANTLTPTETDPKVGTLTSNKIPKWNGTALADGLLFDNGTNIGIGTTTPSRKLTVVNPLSVGIAQLSGTSSARTSIGIGRQDIEGTLNIAANSDEFSIGAAPGDIVLRTETTGQRLVLNSGGGAAALTVLNGNVGVGTISPANKLSVSGNLDISGNLGIGTTIPAGELHVKSVLISNSTIDQQQTNYNASANGAVNWQSFTAGATGLLTRVDLQVSSPISGSSSPGTIKIFMGEGNTGTVLSTTAVTFQNVNSFQSFALNSFPEVIAGNKYTIGFSAPIVNRGWTNFATNNPYAGGKAGADNAWDYSFKTYVASEVADGLVVADGKAKVANLQITNGATDGFILKSDASGNASWVNETDPKVGTLTSNKIPKWNGTALADGLLYDDGTNIGIGTTTPSRKLTVVNPLSVGIAQLSGTSSANTSIGIGRQNVEGTLNIAANSNEFFIGAAPGDIVLKTETSGQRLVLNSGGGAAGLTVLNGNVGVGSISPTTTLDVNGGIKTKYSGTAVVNVSTGTSTPYQIVIPALPAGWDFSNTVVLLSAADGAQGYLKLVKLTSSTSIDIYYEAIQNGAVRFNWIVFKM